ncbi:hypothetical protein [Flavihumibacter fluvii]|uniref:hypothetical protein n=1 Tax=Flavihumibacter fluvii TaxID=2838157 RepID=UPI001BDF3CFA|nr:hypothetical protein [Flavihumibacter fluvii]ULQ50914.1 hypothetical protein KJS93_12550 [Flavihumibacter fluvii]
MKKWLLSLLNPQTLVFLGVAIVSFFSAAYFNLRVSHNMILFSLVISFPLVFSLQAAYKVRERAREYLSGFNAGMIAVSDSFLQANTLSKANQQKIQKIIADLHGNYVEYLKNGSGDASMVLASFSQITFFLVQHNDQLDTKVTFSVNKYMRYVNECGVYLVSTKQHKTVRGIRVLSTIALHLFTFIQAAYLLNTVGGLLPNALIFFISFISSLTLASLQLIQRQLEDPFDQDGFDDIRFEMFSFPANRQKIVS